MKCTCEKRRVGQQDQTFQWSHKLTVSGYLLLQLQHLTVLLALPLSELLRVIPHLPHQLCALSLHGL